MVYECSGLMFWFTQKKFVGSYLVFKAMWPTAVLCGLLQPDPDASIAR